MLARDTSVLASIFPKRWPLIGDVHLPPLPGTPRYKGATMHEIIRIALADAEAYAEGGMDGLVIENHGDIPFLKPGEIGSKVIAAMNGVACAVTRAFDVPIGINLLANDAVGALAIAKACGAWFIRVNQWVNAYVSNEGFVEGESGRALRFRRMISADDVAVFADIHVKHGSHAIVADRPVAEQAADVEFYDADVAIATGNRTGDTISHAEINAIRSGTKLPLIGGSGLTLSNAGELLGPIDGAIVGSSLKHGGVWWNAVERSRVTDLVALADGMRRSDPAPGDP